MRKRLSNEESLGDVIRDVLKRFHLEEKLHEVNFKNYWQKVCGDLIARHTLKMYINKRKLYVKVDSAALRNELSMSRTSILQSLNKEAGSAVVDEIVFL